MAITSTGKIEIQKRAYLERTDYAERKRMRKLRAEDPLEWKKYKGQAEGKVHDRSDWESLDGLPVEESSCFRRIKHQVQ